MASTLLLTVAPTVQPARMAVTLFALACASGGLEVFATQDWRMLDQ